jgi:hypothetical protein
MKKHCQLPAILAGEEGFAKLALAQASQLLFVHRAETEAQTVRAQRDTFQPKGLRFGIFVCGRWCLLTMAAMISPAHVHFCDMTLLFPHQEVDSVSPPP